MSDWRSLLEHGLDLSTVTDAAMPGGDRSTVVVDSLPNVCIQNVSFSPNGTNRLECNLTMDSGPDWQSLNGRKGRVSLTIRTDSLDLSRVQSGGTVLGTVLHDNKQSWILESMIWSRDDAKPLRRKVPRIVDPTTDEWVLHFEIDIDSDEDGDLTVSLNTGGTVRADIIKLECFVPRAAVSKRSTLRVGRALQTVTPPDSEAEAEDALVVRMRMRKKGSCSDEAGR